MAHQYLQAAPASAAADQEKLYVVRHPDNPELILERMTRADAMRFFKKDVKAICDYCLSNASTKFRYLNNVKKCGIDNLQPRYYCTACKDYFLLFRKGRNLMGGPRPRRPARPRAPKKEKAMLSHQQNQVAYPSQQQTMNQANGCGQSVSNGAYVHEHMIPFQQNAVLHNGNQHALNHSNNNMLVTSPEHRAGLSNFTNIHSISGAPPQYGAHAGDQLYGGAGPSEQPHQAHVPQQYTTTSAPQGGLNSQVYSSNESMDVDSPTIVQPRPASNELDVPPSQESFQSPSSTDNTPDADDSFTLEDFQALLEQDINTPNIAEDNMESMAALHWLQALLEQDITTNAKDNMESLVDASFADQPQLEAQLDVLARNTAEEPNELEADEEPNELEAGQGQESVFDELEADELEADELEADELEAGQGQESVFDEDRSFAEFLEAQLEQVSA